MTPPVTLLDAAGALRSGRFSAADLVEFSLAAIERLNPVTNAFIRVDADGARAAARAADLERRHGVDRGLLHGLPISLKDLIDVAGEPTTAGSRVLADRIPAVSAAVVARLVDAGAVILGKTNLHEFGLGTTSEDSAFGPVRHPADPSRSAGGSSGGSAVAVATGMGLASIGTDTGGSIRIPAAACGIVGLKPSQGEVPLAGVVPLSVTLDHVGPLARTVADAAALWTVLTGSAAATFEDADPAALRLRRVEGTLTALLAPDVGWALDLGLARLREAGVTLVPGTLAGAALVPDVYTNLVLPEAALWHARFLDARPDGYTPAVRTRLEGGRRMTAVNYLKARRARALLRDAVDALLDGCHALVLPTLPITAPPLGAVRVQPDPDRDERMLVRAAMLRLTQVFNLTGHPAISIPLETTGLPVGLQLVGRRGATAQLLSIAGACEALVSPPAGG